MIRILPTHFHPPHRVEKIPPAVELLPGSRWGAETLPVQHQTVAGAVALLHFDAQADPLVLVILQLDQKDPRHGICASYPVAYSI